MKKLLIFKVLLLWCAIMQAQNEEDVLRFSQLSHLGTVRTMGLCGAYGALGADLASASINPAGIGMYRRSDASMSLGINLRSTDSEFGGKSTSISLSDTYVNAGAAITTSNVNPGTPFFTFAFYNQKNAMYNGSEHLENVEMPSSLLGVFHDIAQGTDNALLNNQSVYEFTASLAWHAFLLDPLDNSTTLYVTPFDTNDPIDYSYRLEESGQMSNNHISAGYTAEEFMSLGATITLSEINYNRTITHTETPTDPGTDLHYWEYQDVLQTSGEGINLKVGAIAHINKFKMGLAWHSPTKYVLFDRYWNNLNSYWKDGDVYNLSSPEGNIEYIIKTPSRWILSSALVVGKSVVVSCDFETVDFAGGRLMDSEDLIFSPNYNFNAENEAVQASYTRSNELRSGVEVRINSMFRARGGLAYQTSPYSDEAGMTANASTLRFSLGGEYRKDNKYIGLAFTNSQTERDLYVNNPIYQSSPISQALSTTLIVLGGGLRF